MIYTESRQLTSTPGTVEFVTRRSGYIAAKLNAKKSLIFTLYGKAKLLDEGSEIYMDVLDKAALLAMDHDLERMLLAIKSWDLPPEAFCLEMDIYPISQGSIELLSEEVFSEINLIINELWDAPKKTDDELKNLRTALTDTPTEAPLE